MVRLKPDTTRRVQLKLDTTRNTAVWRRRTKWEEDSPMHQHLSDVLGALDASRQALRDAMAAIPADAPQQRPAADRWSTVDMVEHLSLVETRFCAVVGGKIADALTAGMPGETAPREPLPDRISTALANRTNKRTAPEAAVPTGRLDEAAAWAAADKARASFRAAVLSADGRALSTVIHDHPFFGPLNVYQWVELIARHEMRHVEQVRETALQLTHA